MVMFPWMPIRTEYDAAPEFLTEPHLTAFSIHSTTCNTSAYLPQYADAHPVTFTAAVITSEMAAWHFSTRRNEDLNETLG
jgi:hypothetical protein